MSEGVHAVALIPARGGSKGIPRKNIVDLAGRPLIAYTIEAALNSRSIDRVVVSTDDDEIAVIARHLGAEAPFLRPAALSGDEAPAAAVIAHAVEYLEAEDGRPIDYVAYLQPTSPLRGAGPIDRAIRAIANAKADALVSVVEVPHQFGPLSLLVMHNGEVTAARSEPLVLRRQDKRKFYARNGPAVLVLKRSQVGRKDLYSGRTLGMEMGRIESLDIDSPEDLDIAEYFVLKTRNESRRR